MSLRDAYILTGNGNIRSHLLQEQLICLGFSPIIVKGIDAGQQKIEPRFSSILDRYLLPGEIGALETHRKAHEIALKSLTTSIFFEDDASLNSDYSNSEFEELFNLIGNMKRPTIISLYGPVWNVLSNKKKIRLKNSYYLYKSHYPPAGAVAYIANKEALSLSLRANLDYDLPADWPKWSRLCDFFVLTPPAVYPLENSLIIGNRDNQELKFSAVLKAAMNSNFHEYYYHRIRKSIYWHISTSKAQKSANPSSSTRFFN